MADSDILIIYGDGSQGLYYGEKAPRPNRDGVKTQEILVVPSEELKTKYGLVEEDLKILTSDRRRAIWMSYPMSEIEWLDKSRSGTILIFCAFDGSHTQLMNKADGVFEYAKHVDRQNNLLRMQIASLDNEISNLRVNQVEQFRKSEELRTIVGQKSQGDGMYQEGGPM